MVEIFFETSLEHRMIFLGLAVFAVAVCWSAKRDERKSFNDRYKIDQKWRSK